MAVDNWWKFMKSIPWTGDIGNHKRPMRITRKTVADRLAAYLHHKIPLAELVDWAESAMMEGEFEERNLTRLRDVVACIGLADVRAFGLTWEDCEQFLDRLGYSARVENIASQPGTVSVGVREKPDKNYGK